MYKNNSSSNYTKDIIMSDKKKPAEHDLSEDIKRLCNQLCNAKGNVKTTLQNEIKTYELPSFLQRFDQELCNGGNRKIAKISGIGPIAEEFIIKKHPNKNNLAWWTIYEWEFDKNAVLGSNIWLICYSCERIYIFKLPEAEIKKNGLHTTYKTRVKDRKPDWRDIVIDTTDDCFEEVLTGESFKKYLRAKLDFQTDKLYIYPKEKTVTQDGYDERRNDLHNELNHEQKLAADTKSKVSLVVAGAGCGKTKTLLGRIIHLYDSKKIETADDILMVVFNKKNQQEMKNKLADLGYGDRSAHTFHSIGFRICNEFMDGNIKSIDPDEGDPLDVVLHLFELRSKDRIQEEINQRFLRTCEKIYQHIQEKKHEGWIDNLYEWGMTREDKDIDETTLALYKNILKNDDLATQIAWLDTSNISLDVKNYWFGDNDTNKLRMLNYLTLNDYTKDVSIIKKEKCIQITSDSANLKKGSKLFWTNYNLEENFDELANAFPPKPLSDEKTKEKISSAILRKDSYKFRQIAHLFISLCKIYKETDFDKIEKELLDSIDEELNGLKDGFNDNMFNDVHGAKNSMKSEITYLLRQKKHIELFFDLINPVYDMYNKFLQLENCIDFNDMINDAIDALNKQENNNDKFKYKYILVDEFQDISHDTFQLIKALKKRNDASVMCVGDDWQSIYGWKGSDLDFFNNFKEKFGIKQNEGFEELKLQTTYRYGQNLADVSGEFIMKNASQKKKELCSANKKTDIQIWDSDAEGAWDNLLNDIENKINKIKEKREEKDKQISVKILLRYYADVKNILKKNDENLKRELEERFKDVDIEITTIHKAKGLEADIVIILNLIDGSFPSQIQSDVVLQYFDQFKKRKNEDTVEYPEERRLMYVAMTRAKEACYLWAPSQGQKSKFLKEIEEIINNKKGN